jgi:hypothetical protein
MNTGDIEINSDLMLRRPRSGRLEAWAATALAAILRDARCARSSG